MIDDKREWGDFSEWLDRVDDCLGSSDTQRDIEPTLDHASINGILDAFREWMQQLQDAPTTTWKEELNVRGFSFADADALDDAALSDSLWKLLDSLAGLRVFVTNTDHLSDRELYRLITRRYLVATIAQFPLHGSVGCVIDVVGSDVPDDPGPWLSFYASSRERMEWAKQNVGHPLPPSRKVPFPREKQLPKP